jgi:benzodiazapine receptor
MFIKYYKSFCLFLITTFSASLLGSLITHTTKEPWYSYLCKSNLTPPGWVFGIVWPILYLLMALAIWIAFISNIKNKNRLITLYFTQLAINTTWTPVFFYMHNILGALIIIIMLIITLIFLMHEYYQQKKMSFYLMIPYLAWCCFALFLNFKIYILN